MKKICITVLASLLVWAAAQAQSCLPNGITFTTQGQVDSFSINYPGCAAIEGDVTIENASISNLLGLSTIEHVEGNISIQSGYQLTSLQGLNNLAFAGGLHLYVHEVTDLQGLQNLAFVGADLVIEESDSLHNLVGLDSLTKIGGRLVLIYNSSLETLSGLNHLESIGVSLVIEGNEVLNGFAALHNINYLGGDISLRDSPNIHNFDGLQGLSAISGNVDVHNLDADGLKNFVGLDNVTSIGGGLNVLSKGFKSFTGLSNLTSIGGDLNIYSTELENFAGLGNLTTLQGDLHIENNAAFKNFTGLHSNIALLGNVELHNNSALVNFFGLDNVTALPADLTVCENASLTDFSGLNNLTTLGGYLSIEGNAKLTDLTGLGSLTVTGVTIRIKNNPALTSLNGLNSLHYVPGNIEIVSNDSLKSLAGLHVLQHIGGYIDIDGNEALESLAGLENIDTINGGLFIQYNPVLHSLEAIGQLQTIGEGLYLYFNNSLTNLKGLDSLRTLGRDFWIAGNESLYDLTALRQLDSIGGDFSILSNDYLTNLTGLENLRVIRGSLSINNNALLTNISGLANIQSINVYVQITNNPSLHSCAIHPVCDQILHQPALLEISGNGPGCNTSVEVELACGGIPVLATVLLDYNADCQADTTDGLAEGVPVRLSGNIQQALRPTQSDGTARFGYLDNGLFSLSLSQFPTQNWAVCQDTLWFLPDTLQDTIRANFFLQPLNLCPQLTVDLGLPPFFRGCLVNSPMQVTTRNIGTLPADAARVTIVLPDGLELVSSTPAVTLQSGDTLFFEVGELLPFQASTVQMVVKTSCVGAQSGKALCLEAFATWTNPCPVTTPPSSEIRLFSECMNDTTVRFTIKNVGDAATLNAHEYVIIEDEVILHTAPFSLDPLQSLTVDVPTDGSTYRMEATKYDDGQLTATAVENCGGFTPGFITAYWLNEGLRNYDFDCREIRLAYDPNQKTAIPTGVGPEHLLAANKSIQYTIDFQNTGTDTAFRVLLRDILPLQLNVNTFRPGFASHPYTWEIRGADTLEVLFLPIMLPDSNVNEATSHGWFSFGIDQKPNLPDGTTIKNTASIVFDYNPPIITNTVLHTIGKLTVSVDEVQPAGAHWQVLSNPARYAATFRALDVVAGDKRFELSDALGRVVRTERFDGQAFEFRRGSLPGGLYYFRIMDARGRAFSGRIVLIE